MTERILIDHYQGAYGRTIRIDVQSRTELLAVEQLFRDLSSGAANEYDLAASQQYLLRSISSLNLRTVLKRPVKALELLYFAPTGAAFGWSNVCDDWLDCQAKTARLLASGGPGHQYLTAEGQDDALVELCYRE